MEKKAKAGVVFIGLSLLLSPVALAAELSLLVLQGLNFGELPQGAPSETIVPSGSNPSCARFEVSGDPNQSYTIILPSSDVEITTGGGAASERITLQSFTSSPQAGANGLLDASGKQQIYVGATRQSLSMSQSTGSYSGQFVVSVVF